MSIDVGFCSHFWPLYLFFCSAASSSFRLWSSVNWPIVSIFLWSIIAKLLIRVSSSEMSSYFLIKVSSALKVFRFYSISMLAWLSSIEFNHTFYNLYRLDWSWVMTLNCSSFVTLVNGLLILKLGHSSRNI